MAAHFEITRDIPIVPRIVLLLIRVCDDLSGIVGLVEIALDSKMTGQLDRDGIVFAFESDETLAVVVDSPRIFPSKTFCEFTEAYVQECPHPAVICGSPCRNIQERPTLLMHGHPRY